MSQANWQSSQLERSSGWHEFPPNCVATFSIQHLANLQVSLRNRHHITSKSSGLSRWLTTQGRTSHRNSQLQPNQVIRFIHGRVATTGICLQAIFCKATLCIIRRRSKHSIHSPAQVSEDWSTVSLKAGNHLNHSFVFQDAPSTLGSQDVRQVINSTGWKTKTIVGWS